MMIRVMVLVNTIS